MLFAIDGAAFVAIAVAVTFGVRNFCRHLLLFLQLLMLMLLLSAINCQLLLLLLVAVASAVRST